MKVQITIEDAELNGEIFDQSIMDILPVRSIARRYGDEMYVFIDTDIKYESKIDEFEAGDIIYWRSNKTWKRVIAIFFGNTPVGDGTKPRSPSGALKIGKIKDGLDKIDQLKSGDILTIEPIN